MSFETIIVDMDDKGIATLTLNRPEKHNALNAQMIAEITKTCSQLDADKSVRALVLTARGKSFCAGGDLNWMKEQMAADRAGKMHQARKLANMLRVLDSLSKPLIGCVSGNAFGGGIGMMAVCDIVIAQPGLKFALSETKLGLIPATIGPFVNRRIGEAAMRQVMLSAKTFTTQTARQLGLVSYIADQNNMQELLAIEIKAVLRTQPGAISDAKAYLQALRAKPIEEEIEHSINALADRWETDEAQAQISKFLASNNNS